MEGRVRDNVIRPARQSEIDRIRLHHHDAAIEALTQALRASRMRLDCDDPRAHVEERTGDRARAGADVEDDRAASEPRVSDEPARPRGVELVPAPSAP